MKKRTLMRPGTTEDAKSGTVEHTDKKKDPVNVTIRKSKPEEHEKGFRSKLIKIFQIIVLVCIIPPFLNYASLQKEVSQLKPSPGELYDVGWGHKMFKMCHGKGPPTVIFDAPGGHSSDVWSLIWPRVAKHARVCIYDRAGIGFSERPHQNISSEKDNDGTKSPKWQPFTVEKMADDLFRLMTTSSQEPQPFILVGAELGALVSQFYAQMFEGQVMGMVLVNPLSGDLFEQDYGSWAQYWFGQMIPTFQSLQMGAALGLTRLALIVGLLRQPLFDINGIPEEVIYRQKHLMCHPKHLSSVVDEHHFINESFSQLRTVRMLKEFPKNISVTVISGNYYDEQMPSHLNKAWAKSEQNIVSKYYPGSKHILINSADRHMLYKQPDSIIEPINRMVRQWKSKIKTSAKQ